MISHVMSRNERGRISLPPTSCPHHSLVTLLSIAEFYRKLHGRAGSRVAEDGYSAFTRDLKFAQESGEHGRIAVEHRYVLSGYAVWVALLIGIYYSAEGSLR